MLTAEELTSTAARFAVSYEQIRRDHLISHFLAALQKVTRDTTNRPVFFGGTGLARTWLPEGRLSEDIDLYVGNRAALVATIESRRGLTWQLRREFPDAIWDPAPSKVKDVEPATFAAGNGRVRVQILRAEGGFDGYPTEERELILRYADAGTARLRVPTLAAFVAMKTAAWHDRAAPRDLWDLSQLANLQALTQEAANLFRAQTNVTVAPWMFQRSPETNKWAAALSGQTADVGSPEDCLKTVRDSWQQALRWIDVETDDQ
jgi:predicted nucleotidyltransferase component of viral defense system